MVTGSCYVLTSGSGQSILIDLGMFQGIPAIERLNYEPFDYEPSRLVGTVLTHAHLDHCGRLPILIPLGFKGNIWMTPTTRDLTELSLLDAAKIAKDDKKKILFDYNLAEKTIERFKTIDYREPFQIADFTITLRDAGHILGSASLEVEDKQADSPIRKFVFSGDLGNTPEDLLQDTELIDNTDVVVMESTYGDRLHPEMANPSDALQFEIKSVESSGGTLLIPAFSLDRTQELLHMIMHLKKDGKISTSMPVFLDSPMAEKATTIYMKYPGIFNEHIQNDLRTGSPFTFPGFNIVPGKEESDALHGQTGPKVIIAGSGMMTGGRILGHAIHYLPLASTRLLIVGYQGEGTLGRELLEGKREVAIEGVSVRVQGIVSDTQAMSSHADQRQLLNWLAHIKNVKKIFLTHGEDGPRGALAKKISQDLGLSDVVLPVLHQEVDL